jgi:acetylornithine deacetylase/succinyl-diaminopimelate desuccinylase-like protein
MKGPLAAQVHAVGSLVAEGRRPPGDVHVAVVVQEEIGGVGSRHLAARLAAPVVVIGEPSSNEIRRGHRGRIELVLHFLGRSAHASVPALARNPLESAAALLLRLKGLEMRADAALGPSSVAPTSVRTDQASLNVIPAEVWVTCDWRNVPSEREDEVRARLQRVADECCIEGTRCEVTVPSISVRTYTGHAASYPACIPGFLTAADHPAVTAARRALKEAVGLDAETGVYRFATDGGIFAPRADAVIGFGPGDGTLAHTVEERIALTDLERGLHGNRALALAGLLQG